MSDMLERAAKALGQCERNSSSWPLNADVAWEKADRGYKARLRHNGRAALLAALDPEDEALQVAVCQGIGFVTQDGSYSGYAKKQARDAIAKLRACISQGETRNE